MNFKLYIVFFVLLLIVLPVKYASPDDQLAEILNGVGDRYGEISGLTADYTRESISKTMAMLKAADKHDLAKGKLFFQSPNFLVKTDSWPSVLKFFLNVNITKFC